MTPIAADGSEATGINDLAQVVGTEDGAGFLWDDGEITYLTGLPFPRAINNAGQVVGRGGGGGVDIARIWEDGVATDLIDLIPPDSGWNELEWAMDINDAGQIVGWGLLDDGDRRGFMLTPIPEPATLGLLVMGTLSLIWKRRQAR
jgi:uncharacterized membrane protein